MKAILISIQTKWVAKILNGEKTLEYATMYIIERAIKIYQNMRQRCYNPKSARYERYGGRGIKICDEWLGKQGKKNFVIWAIENGYCPDLSIERIDINKDYCPTNCKWIELKEQSKNKCCTHLITHNGKTQCLEEWCRELGLKSKTIFYRVKTKNISFEDAIFDYQPYKKNDKKCCPQGHEYTEENTIYTSQGYRVCKTCLKLKRPIYNANRREKRRLSKNG